MKVIDAISPTKVKVVSGRKKTHHGLIGWAN